MSNGETLWVDVGQRLFAYSPILAEFLELNVITTWTDGRFEVNAPTHSRLSGDAILPIRGHMSMVGTTFFFTEDECRRSIFWSRLKGQV